MHAHRLRCVVWLVMLLAGPQALAERLTASGPRPVADALRELEEKFAYTITYEDPRYEFAEDLKDVTDEIRRGPPASSQTLRTLVPRGGTISVEYSLGTDGKPTDPAGLIQSVVDAARDLGLRFRLERSGEFFHVIPEERRDRQGRFVLEEALLDSHISLPPKPRTVQDLLDQVAEAVKRASHADVDLGLTPINALLQRRSARGAAGERARDVVRAVLAETGLHLSWSLLCMGDPAECALNVHFVRFPPREVRLAPAKAPRAGGHPLGSSGKQPQPGPEGRPAR